MRFGAPEPTDPGLLVCDRCGLELPITPNTTPEDWRFLMTNVATVAADLCPECVEAVLSQLQHPVSVDAGGMRRIVPRIR